MKTTLLAVLISIIVSAAHAQQQQPAQQPVQQLDPVQVRKSGVSAVTGYGPINTLLDGLQRHGEGLFRFEFHLKAKSAAAEPPTLALLHADFYRPLAVAADGLVELPVLPEAQARDTDIVTNQAKGQVQLRGSIELTTPPGELTLAGVRRILATGNRLKRELLPWYARLLFPSIGGVRACSAQPGWEMQWRDDKGQLWGVDLPQAAGERDPASPDAPRACTILSGQEHWPETARLVAPTGTTLSVKLL